MDKTMENAVKAFQIAEDECHHRHAMEGALIDPAIGVEDGLLAAMPFLLANHQRDVVELERLRGLVNSPELHDFSKGVVLEASHQRDRWGTNGDVGKEPADWFWLLGYLSGKALKAHSDGNVEKALHHTISSAAALANWHGAILGSHNMRAGIDGEAALAASPTPPALDNGVKG